jgi:hypothetical protein
MNPFSLRDNWFKFKTSRRLPIHLEELMEYILNLMKKIWKVWTCIQLVWETVGSQRIMPKNFPTQLGTKGDGFITYEHNSHPSNLKSRSPIDLWMVHLHLGFLKSILVWNQLNALTSRLHTILGLLCWMNVRYARMQYVFPSLLWQVEICW